MLQLHRRVHGRTPLSSTVQVVSVWRAEICGLVYVAQFYGTSARLPLPMTDASLRQTPLISVTAEANKAPAQEWLL